MLLKAAASLKRLKTVLRRVGQRSSDTQHFVMCACDSGEFGTERQVRARNRKQKTQSQGTRAASEVITRSRSSRPFPSLHGP